MIKNFYLKGTSILLKRNKSYKNKKGISIVEVIIASAIISISMISITNVYGNFLTLSLANTEKVQAVFLLDEGVEAIKTMRNYSWSSVSLLSVNLTYYLTWQNSRWQATTTPNIIDNKFIRTFTVSNVHREPSTLNIVNSGYSVLNADSKRVNLNVSWNYKGATTSRQTSFYIFNLYE